MEFKHADTVLLVTSTVIYAAVGSVLWLLLDAAAVVPLSTLLLSAVFALLLHQRRIRERQDAQQLRQIQALLTLYRLIPFRAPPPAFSGWAATPEFALILYDLVRAQRPSFVLELGSGSSSVVIAAALEQNGHGHLVSIDQDRAYATETRAALARQGLDHVAEVTHIPIAPTMLDGREWLWYDQQALPTNRSVDLLVIDGPNRELQEMARYPALPILLGRLADDAIVVLDDAGRKDERRTIDRWLDEIEGLQVECRDSPKGTAIIRRTPKRITKTVAT